MDCKTATSEYFSLADRLDTGNGWHETLPTWECTKFGLAAESNREMESERIGVFPASDPLSCLDCLFSSRRNLDLLCRAALSKGESVILLYSVR